MNSPEVEFSKARNGELTCSLNERFFHSSYNPDSEAQKFVNSIKIDFLPSCLIILEPALSYCAKYLRTAFPETKIIAIRITNAFNESDCLWDKVLYYKKENFAQILFNSLGEENLINAGVFGWTGSSNIFSTEFSEIWNDIKNSILTARSVLYTRANFASRWFFNSLNFLTKTKQFTTLNKIDNNILITASGPSLNSSISKIKENRNSFYLMAVSSSLSVLLNNNIFPDMVISTDGGWWAKKHLEPALKYKEQLKNTVFALCDEGAYPAELLSTFNICPLIYDDSTGETLFSELSIPYLYALRNGTVSGTAAQLALSLTTQTVYFCGLDLCPSPSFQHTNPNRLEIRSSSYDYKLKNKESRMTASRFNSQGSLEIYRNWFKTQNPGFSSRLKRLSNNYTYSHNLLPVEDINWNQFSPSNTSPVKTTSYKNNTESTVLSGLIKKVLHNPQIINELFPVESVMLKRSNTTSEIEQINSSISSKLKNIENKSERILNGHSVH